MTDRGLSNEPAPEEAQPSIWARLGVQLRAWIQEEGPWWLCSFVFHLVLVCSLALIGTKVMRSLADSGDAPSFDAADVEAANATLDVEPSSILGPFVIGDTPEDPTSLTTEDLTMPPPGAPGQEEIFYDNDSVFAEAGGTPALASNQPNVGGLGMDLRGLGPGGVLKGQGGAGVGIGAGVHAGIGGEGFGFASRSSGNRKAMLGSGGTRASERAVSGALDWLKRHQSSDGSWSLSGFTSHCIDRTCINPRVTDYAIAATALGLLPFLAAGQTHEAKGPYRKNIASAVYFLISHQKADGSFTGSNTMYDHGLASIALCECYGMTKDLRVGKAAQAALDFIAQAQDPAGGGWRYQPRTPGDTSVTGWQVMALKSGQMAYLNVNPTVLESAKRFLEFVSFSSSAPNSLDSKGGLFGYTDKTRSTSATNAVGLLCCQYLDMPRTDPAMVEGTAYLMSHLPATGADSDIYYWYYATQVMHNQPGAEWDAWNRQMRKRLIHTQIRSGCASGSWDPTDKWGSKGGRLMQTALAALTLEVYYRYLPLYNLDRGIGGAPPVAAEKTVDAKTATGESADEKPRDEKP